MTKIKVGVLRGGISDEYDVSLKTGGAVLETLSQKNYAPYDILITKDGQWHINGYPVKPEKVARTVDVVWNGLHGEYGEDGKVQQVLETLSVPYTGSGPIASAVGMHKAFAKARLADEGIRVPEGFVVRRGERGEEVAESIFRRMGPPYIVKPLSGGSSLGLSIARNSEELARAVSATLMYTPAVIVEEYLRGREVVAGSVEGSRGEMHALWPLEVELPKGAEVFSHEIKYGGLHEYVPLESRAESEDIAHIMQRTARALSMEHYFRADFIITPRGIYLLEVNTLPELTRASSFPKMIEQSGSTMGEFIDHVVLLALTGK